MEKLRTKLDRDKNAQKPKLEIISQKKEELNKRLALSAGKETLLCKEFDRTMQDVSNDDLKQLVYDAMRMKQLEVLFSLVILPLRFHHLKLLKSGCSSRSKRSEFALNKGIANAI